MEQQFKPVNDNQIRDIVVRFDETNGRMTVKTQVREKNFWERHDTFRAIVVLLATTIPLVGLTVGLWQHNIAAIVGAFVLRVLWVMLFVPQLGGAVTEIEKKHDDDSD